MKRRTRENRAQWLKETLISRGLSEYGLQSMVAKRIGCSKSTAQNWLRGGVGNGELAFELAYEFDFSVTEWIWSEYDSKQTFGPRRLKYLQENLKDLSLSKNDELSEAALRKTLDFISTHMSPQSGEEFNDEWREAFVTIFKILKKNEELGVDIAEDLLEVARLTRAIHKVPEAIADID